MKSGTKFPRYHGVSSRNISGLPLRQILTMRNLIGLFLFNIVCEGLIFVPTSQHLSNRSQACDSKHFQECSQIRQNTSTDFCRNFERCVLKKCNVNKETCNSYELPRTYIAYHLNGATINMDGVLDDQAWQDVPWTDSFVDVRGFDYPKPYFDTKVKVRWDDSRLYVAARMEETDFWGTFTKDESLVYLENSFEVFIVPDGSMHNYKELEISVRNVTWDLRMRKPYLDSDPCTDPDLLRDNPWSSNMEKKTYTDGVVNDINGTGTYWSVEMAIPFSALSQNTNRKQDAPNQNEAWFMLFTRPEHKFKIENGSYTKDEDAATSYWSWNPTLAVNYHIPNRYGLVQFKKNRLDNQFYSDGWHIYKALFEMFDALHTFKVLNGMFTTDIHLIKPPAFVASSTCVDVNITFANGTDFEVTATSRVDTAAQTGHIRTDRYVWFT